ncbi:MAG: hypothetical protein ACRDGT_11805, partial [Candidatus Limnocylindria bacterium]
MGARARIPSPSAPLRTRGGPAARASASAPRTFAARDGAAALLAYATQEILSVTYWLDPGDRGEPFSAQIRFSGQRTAAGKPGPRDRFSQVESVEIVPGSGPLSVTTKVFGIEPGTWTVGAEPVFRKGAPAIRGYVARGH